MLRKRTNFCIIDFDAGKSALTMRALGALDGMVTNCGQRQISDELIARACKEYWEFVDTAITLGELSNGDAKRINAFFDELMTHGVTLCNKLLDASMRRHLWTLAMQSDVLVLITGLLHVPWEALYNPDAASGSFLSDHCVVIRYPENTGDLNRAIALEVDFSKDRLICLDKVLAGELVFDEICVEDLLKKDGEEVYLTSQKSDLVKQVRNVRLVHWICEHDKLGLRLDSDVYYTAEDSAAHRFQQGSILILTSCSAGSRFADEASIAARICVASNCTVIAPSSVVAAPAGVNFARKVNAIIRTAEGPLSVVDLWSAIKGPSNPDGCPTARTAEMCYAKWYGIYGNGEAFIRTQ